MSEYRRPYKRKIPKRSQTLPVPGKGDDYGKYYHCWNCGFVCNVDRDELGDADSKAGDDHTDYHNLANPDPYTDNIGRIATIRCYTEDVFVLQKLGLDGETPVLVEHANVSEVSRGCPMCGSTNWRGDY